MFRSPVIVCVIVDVADDDAVSVAVDIDVVAVIDDVAVDDAVVDDVFVSLLNRNAIRLVLEHSSSNPGRRSMPCGFSHGP